MRRTPTAAMVAVLVAALTLVVGATAAFAKSSTATTTTPPTYAAALQARLAKEWKDADLAAEIVGGLSAETLASFEARVPMAQVATSPFLSYRPKTIPAKDVDSLIVYSFGNEIGANGEVTPGRVNEQLAKQVYRFVIATKGKAQVFAQHEVADSLIGIDGLERIDDVVGPDGKVVYLSTAGVAEQAKAKGASGKVAVLCFADHAGRCVLTTEKVLGITGVGVPKGVDLPGVYEPQSGQSWTRDRKSYLQTDLVGRLATL